GHIAGAVGPDGQHFGLEEPCANKDQARAIDGPRYIGKPLPIAHRPDLFSRSGIVSNRAERTRTYGLRAALDVNYQRRGVSLIPGARGSPSDLSRFLVEPHDVLSVLAIATEDQQILEQYGRAARTVLRGILEPVTPDAFSRIRDAGRAVGAEVKIHE